MHMQEQEKKKENVNINVTALVRTTLLLFCCVIDVYFSSSLLVL